MPAERVGVFGGTFDPVHVGHVGAAVEARRALGLDRVLMVVAGDPWQKRGQMVARAAAPPATGNSSGCRSPGWRSPRPTCGPGRLGAGPSTGWCPLGPSASSGSGLSTKVRPPGIMTETPRLAPGTLGGNDGECSQMASG